MRAISSTVPVFWARKNLGEDAVAYLKMFIRSISPSASPVFDA
jgi:hypothetical protein